MRSKPIFQLDLLEKEKRESERILKERNEAERKEIERIQTERREAERIEAERNLNLLKKKYRVSLNYYFNSI